MRPEAATKAMPPQNQQEPPGRFLHPLLRGSGLPVRFGVADLTAAPAAEALAAARSAPAAAPKTPPPSLIEVMEQIGPLRMGRDSRCGAPVRAHGQRSSSRGGGQQQQQTCHQA